VELAEMGTLEQVVFEKTSLAAGEGRFYCQERRLK